MSARPLVLWLLLLAVPLAGACGAPPATDADIVSIGIGEPKFLVPSTTTESNGADVLEALFTPLVRYDDQFRPYEVAAWSITSGDNQVWTITLEDGWTFHNGEPVTADNYINAWNAGAWGPNAHDGNYFFDKIDGYGAMNPRDAGQEPTATKLTGLEKVDDLTFRVTLSEPYVNFKSMLGYTAFLPVPMAAFSDIGNNVLDPAYNEAPIGQGPFRMEGTWEHDQIVRTRRYEDYAGPEQARVGGIDFKIYQQPTTQYQDLLAGQLDIVPVLPLESLASAEADLGDRFEMSPASLVQILAFPTFDPKYADPRIRRAISMAIDREAISETIFLDSERPLRSFVSPVVPGYRENTCGEACEFQPEEARRLFEDAGGDEAVDARIQITYNVDGGHKAWVDATCNQLRANLGVDCVGNPEARFSEMLTKVEDQVPVGMFRMGWIFDYPAMENYLGPLYSTYGSSNYYGYSNPEFDRLVAAGDAAATPEDATVFYQQAEDILAEDLPVIPLRYGVNRFGYSARVANVSMDLFNKVVMSEIELAP